MGKEKALRNRGWSGRAESVRKCTRPRYTGASQGAFIFSGFCGFFLGEKREHLGVGVLVPLLLSTVLAGRPQHFHTKQGSGHGRVTLNPSPSSPAQGWPRQEGKEGTLAGSHKAQETGSTAGSRLLSREGLSTSNQ